MTDDLINKIHDLIPKVSIDEINNEMRRLKSMNIELPIRDGNYVVSRYLEAERMAKIHALAVELLTSLRG